MEDEHTRTLRQKFTLRRDIFKEFMAEILGTFVLILCGCGSVAQSVLSNGTLGNPLTIHIGFTLGVMVGVYIAGGVSGGHLNPAVSLAMVILKKLPLKKFPVYVLAQFLGAFIGSCIVYALYYDAFMFFTHGEFLVTGANATANIFASYPAEHLSVSNGLVDQVIATAFLVLGIQAITDKKNIGAPKGTEPLIIGLLILAIGVSMGLNCGYPINPARDLSPRIFTAIVGWGTEVFRAGGCWWWVPVVGPMIGGPLGAGIYLLIIKLHRQKPEKQGENNIQDIQLIV